MLSIENPSDPSCSCKSSRLKGDGRAGEELALQGASDLVKPTGLDETQRSHFSIRDYVFTARSKDIGANWPFQQDFLQLCLKHGINDPLPPFEPPDFVRDQRCKKAVRSQHQYTCVDSEKDIVETDPFEKEGASLLDLQDNCVKHKPSQLLDQSILEYLDQGDKGFCRFSKSLGSNEVGGKGDFVSTLTTEVEINSNPVPADRIYSSLREANSSISEASIEFEALEPPPPSNRTGILIGTSTNKCQLIVNLGVVSESSQPEAIIPSSSTSSEPMASKVCPVCKTFASTSNTTLNAHIDQCLASESTGKEVLTDRTKYRVKLRKKRLMSDIYATAPHCTLEDLDRRNGTSWAIDSNSMAINGEMRMEKRPRIGQVDVGDDGDDEHEVYVDSTGTKLRILSKFNDNVAPTVGDDFSERTHLKMKASKIHFGNKKRFGQKLSKLLKDEPQSKKLRSLKLHNREIPEELNEDYHMDNCEKEKSLSQLLNAQNSTNADGSGAWSRWACSKRSSLSKKSSNRDERGFAGDRPLIKSNFSTSDNSSTKRNHILKFSRLLEDPTAPPRSKGEEILSKNIDNCERTSPRPHGNNLKRLMDDTSIADGCMMKLPRSSGSYAASPRSKRVEVKAGTAQRSPKPPESHQFSLKAKKSSTLRSDLLLGKPSYPLEQIKSSDNRKSLSLQKSRQGRYVAEMSELIGGVASDVDEGYEWIHDSTGVLRPRSVNQNEKHSTQKLNRLEDLMGSETEATSTEESMESDKRIESEQDVSTSEQEENGFPERLHFPVEYCGPDMASGYLEDGCNSNQYNKSEDQESAAGEVAEKVFRDNIVSIGETQSSNGTAHAPHTDARASVLDEDHGGRIFRSKSQVDPATPGSCDDKDMNFVDRGGDNAQAATKIEAGSFTEANLTLIQRLGTSFLSPGDTGYEAQENSSVTSSGLHFARDEHQRVDRDQSGSPVSADSAMSSPPTTKSNFKCSGLEAPSLGTEIQNKGGVSFSGNTAKATLTDAPDLCPGSVLPSSPRTVGSEKAKLEEENLEVTVSAVKKSSKFSDDQPCCRSPKETIYWSASMSYPEWQLQIPKGIVSALVMPPNGGEETTFNSNTRPEICSSFSSGSGSQIDEVVIPTLDSPVGSILTRASSNASAKLQTCSDFSLGSPSSQTPSPSSTCSSILRLMGKDLMVMSKDEDVFVGAPKNPSAAPNDNPNSKYLALFGFPTSNVANQDTISFHGRSPDSCFPPKNFDAFSGGLSSNCKVSNQSPLQLPINHVDMNTAGFVGSAVQQGSEGRSDGQSQQKTLNKIPNFPFSNIDRSSHRQCPEPVSVSQAAKLISEVIVIDDSPELGLTSGSVNAKYSIGSRGNQPLPMGIPPLSVSNFNSRPMNVFSCFPPSSNFSTEQLPVGSNPSFLMSCPGANASFTKQGGSAAEGLGILSPVPPILPSPSTGYLNSTLYYSPSLR